MKLQLFGNDVDKVNVGKSFTLKHLRLRTFKQTHILNTSKSDPFVCVGIKAIPNLVKVDDISSISFATIVAKIIGLHLVTKSYLCVSCNKKCAQSTSTINQSIICEV